MVEYGTIKKAIENATVQTNIQNRLSDTIIFQQSSTQTASGTGNDIDVGKYIVGEICIDVTNVSGTFNAGEGLRILIEGKDETTGKYRTLYDSDSSLGSRITNITTDWLTITSLAFRYIRVRWEISGTSPSFTFSVSGQFKT